MVYLADFGTLPLGCGHQAACRGYGPKTKTCSLHVQYQDPRTAHSPDAAGIVPANDFRLDIHRRYCPPFTASPRLSSRTLARRDRAESPPIACGGAVFRSWSTSKALMDCLQSAEKGETQIRSQPSGIFLQIATWVVREEFPHSKAR